MSIEVTYKNYLVEQFIREGIKRGIPPSTTKITEYVNGLNKLDLSKPRFQAVDYAVVSKESASASKFNNTWRAIRQDLSILYEEMLRLSKVAIDANERWPIEAKVLEKDLKDLELRIDALLFTAQDTEGYFDTVADNFTDLSLFDRALSTCGFDLTHSMVHLCALPASSSWVDCTHLKADHAKFRLRSVLGNTGLTYTPGPNMEYKIFQQTDSGWMANVTMAPGFKDPVTCELTVKLPSLEPIAINQISLDLNSSDPSTASALQVTPLYSVDNVNWSQLPSTTPTQELRGQGAFTFSTISAQWIKFILTKIGPDDETNYRFGFKNIRFAKNGFVPSVAQSFISLPLWVTTKDGEPEIFSKLSLEACEQVDADTSINYYIATSNDPAFPVSENTLWTPITPIGRVATQTPHTVYVTEAGVALDLGYGTGGDINATLAIEYTASGYLNPSLSFNVLGVSGVVSGLDNTTRFIFGNANEGILNYQLSNNLPINWKTLQIFRNVFPLHQTTTPATAAPEVPNTYATVRGTQVGWGFTDPYYTCVVQILSPAGIDINFGSRGNNPDVIIDGTAYQGKVTLAYGLHSVKVHKDNWRNIPKDPANPYLTPEDLAAQDPLYPYNHKHLLEGITYFNAGFTGTKVYIGVDLLAECLMKEVSPFDMLHNVPANRYNLFAVDTDVPDSHIGGNDPNYVFIVKLDEANPDFQNEHFVIRFSQIGTEAKYIRLRADLMTNNENVSPILHGYKIKVG